MAVPPDESDTLVGESVAVMPEGVVEVSETVPLKPPRLFRVIVVWFEVPDTIRELGLAETVKLHP